MKTPIEIPMGELEHTILMGDPCGVCLSCGEVGQWVEPDAENYTCDSCGEKTVFGLEQALLMGKVTGT